MRVFVLLTSIALLAPHFEDLSPAGASARSALAAIIATEQKAHVRPSYGELADQCFTWLDLTAFTSGRIPEQIVRRLRRDSEFQRVAVALRGLGPAERKAVLEHCRRPLRPTWREQGRVSPAGTTEAGQKAELLIADAIVRLTSELSGASLGAASNNFPGVS